MVLRAGYALCAVLHAAMAVVAVRSFLVLRAQAGSRIEVRRTFWCIFSVHLNYAAFSTRTAIDPEAFIVGASLVSTCLFCSAIASVYGFVLLVGDVILRILYISGRDSALLPIVRRSLPALWLSLGIFTALPLEILVEPRWNVLVCRTFYASAGVWVLAVTFSFIWPLLDALLQSFDIENRPEEFASRLLKQARTAKHLKRDTVLSLVLAGLFSLVCSATPLALHACIYQILLGSVFCLTPCREWLSLFTRPKVAPAPLVRLRSFDPLAFSKSKLYALSKEAGSGHHSRELFNY